MLPNGTRHYSNGFEAGLVTAQGYTEQRALDGARARTDRDPRQQQRGQTVNHGPQFPQFNDPNNALGTSALITAKNDQAVRRRISRACDQCNQLRTKCDGKQPCAHCAEAGLSCDYARQKKKRGKASKKDTAAQQNTNSDGLATSDTSPRSMAGSEFTEPIEQDQPTPRGVKRKRSFTELKPAPPQSAPPPPPQWSNEMPEQQVVDEFDQSFLNPAPPAATRGNSLSMFSVPRLASADMAEHIIGTMSAYAPFDNSQRDNLYSDSAVVDPSIPRADVSSVLHPTIHVDGVDDFKDTQYGVASPNHHQALPGPAYTISESPLSPGLLSQTSASASTTWVPLTSPSSTLQPRPERSVTDSALRYPVLQALVPYIAPIIPLGLACDLLEHYFTSTSSVYMHPQSPYILGYVFRKRSVMRQQSPRPSSLALLASMLWVAAQTSESAFLSSPPSTRGNICQQLLELTLGLLKPLIHAASDENLAYGTNSVVNGVALGGFGVPGQSTEMDGRYAGASGTLDDVATYIHLATVVSASEYKAASLRWWNAAWSLARELKLNKELPPNSELRASPMAAQEGAYASSDAVGGSTSTKGSATRVVHDEEREERRRIWWLLYSVDRHLALCYNRPLFLLDMECSELLHPARELFWQAGEFYEVNTSEEAGPTGKGPPLICNGLSIFGCFLPLMTILGEIVELNQARNHPRFGLVFHNGTDWTEQVQEISRQLDAYGQSMEAFEAECNRQREATEAGALADASSNQETLSTGVINVANDSPGIDEIRRRIKDCTLRTKAVMSYGTYIMHTLHILLNGKWDPISLLDDNDLWISSPSFLAATGHAVSASEALNEILEYDPDLSFMPFFFGIYLLQGSFLHLMIADKLQGDASPRVVKSCETIVRAHEACVVTLSTEYQKNFRKVMRSALAQVRGTTFEDVGEQQKRRREVLALYRWTGDGTGLAL